MSIHTLICDFLSCIFQAIPQFHEDATAAAPTTTTK